VFKITGDLNMATKTIGKYKLTKEGKLVKAPAFFPSVSARLKHKRRTNQLRLARKGQSP
jgi:hypothetical protein